jgi:hypothetical protein
MPVSLPIADEMALDCMGVWMRIIITAERQTHQRRVQVPFPALPANSWAGKAEHRHYSLPAWGRKAWQVALFRPGAVPQASEHPCKG